MIIECTSCQARYQYDEDRFERKPAKKIKCAKCGTIFDIHNPAFAPKPASNVGESTAMRREETRTRAQEMPSMQETTAEAPIPERDTGPKPIVTELPSGRRISLAILAGPDAGTMYRIEKPRITIGRSGADLTINDTEASRQHAAIEVREDGITVEDLKSTNGTTVDGQKLTEPAQLQDKSEFQIGTTTLMLIVTDEG
ncbi:MAG TPA: FHA domain-containing protein [Thermoanaerobaculia bacterium]|nr:FHA domain-containing protein [Thermoanaerobaculia bacterium]